VKDLAGGESKVWKEGSCASHPFEGGKKPKKVRLTGSSSPFMRRKTSEDARGRGVS